VHPLTQEPIPPSGLERVGPAGWLLLVCEPVEVWLELLVADVGGGV